MRSTEQHPGPSTGSAAAISGPNNGPSRSYSGIRSCSFGGISSSSATVSGSDGRFYHQPQLPMKTPQPLKRLASHDGSPPLTTATAPHPMEGRALSLASLVSGGSGSCHCKLYKLCSSNNSLHSLDSEQLRRLSRTNSWLPKNSKFVLTL